MIRPAVRHKGEYDALEYPGKMHRYRTNSIIHGLQKKPQVL